MGGFPWRHSHIKLRQGAFRPPVSLVPPVSLLVGFPEQVELVLDQHSSFRAQSARRPPAMLGAPHAEGCASESSGTAGLSGLSV